MKPQSTFKCKFILAAVWQSYVTVTLALVVAWSTKSHKETNPRNLFCERRMFMLTPLGSVVCCLIPVCLTVAQVTKSSLVSLDYILKMEVAIEEILKRVKAKIKPIKINELNIASKHPIKNKRQQKGFYKPYGRKKWRQAMFNKSFRLAYNTWKEFSCAYVFLLHCTTTGSVDSLGGRGKAAAASFLAACNWVPWGERQQNRWFSVSLSVLCVRATPGASLWCWTVFWQQTQILILLW